MDPAGLGGRPCHNRGIPKGASHIFSLILLSEKSPAAVTTLQQGSFICRFSRKYFFLSLNRFDHFASMFLFRKQDLNYLTSLRFLSESRISIT